MVSLVDSVSISSPETGVKVPSSVTREVDDPDALVLDPCPWLTKNQIISEKIGC